MNNNLFQIYIYSREKLNDSILDILVFDDSIVEQLNVSQNKHVLYEDVILTNYIHDYVILDNKRYKYRMTITRSVNVNFTKKISYEDFKDIIFQPRDYEVSPAKKRLVITRDWSGWVCPTPARHLNDQFVKHLDKYDMLWVTEFGGEENVLTSTKESVDFIKKQLNKLDLTKYNTCIFSSVMAWYDKDPDYFDNLFKNIIKIQVRNDLHFHKRITNEQLVKYMKRASFIDYYISAYTWSAMWTDNKPILEDLIPIQPYNPVLNKGIRLPHANPDHYKPITTPLKDRINCGIVAGCSKPTTYPMRQSIIEEINPLCILKHPGYQFGNKNLIKDQPYINLLGNYVCALTTCATVKYVLNKYIEIPLAGCVLIAEDLPELRHMGFKHRENCLLFSTIEECKQLYQEVLDNPEKFQDIATAGQQLVLKRHSSIQRFKEFEVILDNIEEEWK